MYTLFILNSVVTKGVQIAVVGYVIVFMALVLLYFIFTYLAKGLIWQKKKKLQRSNKLQEVKNDDIVVTGEVAAAISMAIFLCRDLHDTESDIITIKKVSKIYSPWNSKIYGMRYFNR